MSTHNICFFTENWRKLSKNYHQISLLNKPSDMGIMKLTLNDHKISDVYTAIQMFLKPFK